MPFHTASPRTRVNKGKRKDRSLPSNSPHPLNYGRFFMIACATPPASTMALAIVASTTTTLHNLVAGCLN
jgi:hypothetical protein